MNSCCKKELEELVDEVEKFIQQLEIENSDSNELSLAINSCDWIIGMIIKPRLKDRKQRKIVVKKKQKKIRFIEID